ESQLLAGIIEVAEVNAGHWNIRAIPLLKSKKIAHEDQSLAGRNHRISIIRKRVVNPLIEMGAPQIDGTLGDVRELEELRPVRRRRIEIDFTHDNCPCNGGLGVGLKKGLVYCRPLSTRPGPRLDHCICFY